MASATMRKMPEKSINWLQDLIQVNIDSRDGFKDAAENLKGKNLDLETLFRDLSRQRAAQATELQDLVARDAETPEKSGSVAAAAHRAWMDIRAALGGGEHAILSEAEGGEDHIKEKYEKAINDLPGCGSQPILQKHYAGVAASHDRIRDLRDRFAKS